MSTFIVFPVSYFAFSGPMTLSSQKFDYYAYNLSKIDFCFFILNEFVRVIKDLFVKLRLGLRLALFFYKPEKCDIASSKFFRSGSDGNLCGISESSMNSGAFTT
jgi:hypothetical protein